MLSCLQRLNLFVLLVYYPLLVSHFTATYPNLGSERQLLDCTTTRSIRGIHNGSICDDAQPESSFNTRKLPRPANESPATRILSIDFNNILKRRHIRSDENCTTDQLQTTDVVCAPNKRTFGTTSTKAISITIVPNATDQFTIDALTFSSNSTNVIHCHFSLSPASNVTELDFKLRWLRSVTSQNGIRNQSISSDANGHAQQQISVSVSRVLTAQREGGLDLILNDAIASDSGDYFCQAVGLDSSILDEKRIHLKIHNEDLSNFKPFDEAHSVSSAIEDASDIYSADNLAKLLPSLAIIPDYAELALGESTQLACVTTGLDPDPDPEKIEWTFEPFERPGYVPSGVNLRSAGDADSGSLPPNTTQVGNVLIIWSMSYETIGIYKCSHHMEELNLTAEASGELALRPNPESAPIVFMTPELLRLSAKGSARVQCESTGYPPPQIEWYRVETAQVINNSIKSDDMDTKNVPQQFESRPEIRSSLEGLDGLEVHHLKPQDSMAFCLQSGCRTLDNLDSTERQNQDQQRTKVKPKTLVTGLSWIQIDQARASHQGQYVCKATNKHGSNQASSIIDVEFKETPRVDIPNEHRNQVIVLDERDGFDQSSRLQSIEFNCSLKAGRPKARLKWLRTNWRKNYIRKTQSKHLYGNAATNNFDANDYLRKLKPYSGSSDDLEIYDLTTVSSATSRVSTQTHDDGKTLVLQLSTISVDDEGDYVCLGENELGRHSAVAHLVVRKLAKVRILQSSPKIFRPNESFQLDCLVTGHPNPIDIEWSRSDKGAFFALISRQSPSVSADQERAVLKFDRVTGEDSGEYTCAARDPMNQAIILKDTIMLMAEESGESSRADYHLPGFGDVSRQSPKLLVRPTKITAELGSNVTLDCIAVSGLQPTVVEWLAPLTALSSESQSPLREHVTIRPYYRSQMVNLAQDGQSSSLLQFGSRLRLFNVSKAHEGVYQCKGRNKVGVENAPAFVEIIDNTDKLSLNGSDESLKLDEDSRGGATKTKIAKMGTNIELRCQVNGSDGLPPATSWSREDRELPGSSVQIDHNLWIQNLTKADEGLYLCSARSSEPNEILQARIRLLVSEDEGLEKRPGDGKLISAKLEAKIIPSKTHLIEGDSVTLECVINQMDGNNNSHFEDGSGRRPTQFVSSNDLAELERQVIWTNLQSGESLFQDNVYIQSNLLIVYNLKRENSATYRCNYNDLTQFTDYKLIVAHNESLAHSSDQMNSTQQSAANSSITNQQQQAQIVSDKSYVQNVTQYLWDNHQTKHVIVPMGTSKVLDCKSQSPNDEYFWTFNSEPLPSRQSGAANLKLAKTHGSETRTLTLDQIDTNQSGLYQCNRKRSPNSSIHELDSQFLVEVSTVAAKFVQRPVSFVTLPAVSDADHRLELELKFYPENEHGLMLFSGGVLNNLVSGQQQQTTSEQSNRTSGPFNNVDYISLGLVRGHLEFRFELGDGTTTVRSLQPVEMNRWHKVLIERNRRGASMWLDGQSPSSNSSMGKFFNLDLDSLLYVGGHQVFLSISNANNRRQQGWRKAHGSDQGNVASDRINQTSGIRSFYGFSRGFKGCISSLKINQRELNLMARNRSVTVGIFECDKAECPSPRANLIVDKFECPSSRGLCQIDRTISQSQSRQEGAASSPTTLAKRAQSHPDADLRCLCFPNYFGSACNETVQQSVSTAIVDSNATHNPNLNSTQCNSTSLCNLNGTSQCEWLSSTSYKCHCVLGFTGKNCDRPISYANETFIGFNQSAHIQLAFKQAQEALEVTPTNASSSQVLDLDGIEYKKLITFTEQQNISFMIQTRASYGLLLYIGQDLGLKDADSLKIDTNVFQPSKSIVANALSRLTLTKVSDFLAVALVDGHIELSYELGSGLAVLRSSKRYNDGSWHKIEISRLGKASKLIIDDVVKHKAQSPGKLSMLNVGQDIYLGGLPGELLKLLSASGSGSSGSLLATFTGCLSELKINSLGPINLVRSDHMTQLKSARNLVPCGESLLSAPQAGSSPVIGDKISIDQEAIKPMTTTTTPTMTLRKTTRKPTKPSYSNEADGDDSDELARSS